MPSEAMAPPATDAPVSPTPLADANQRLQPYAPSTDHVFEYERFTIVLPKKYASCSEFLVRSQELAIDSGAVYYVKRDTNVHILGWTPGRPQRVCIHVNLCPVARDKLHYPPDCIIALLERDGLVVAGVFLLSIAKAIALEYDKDRMIDLSCLDQHYDPFLALLPDTDQDNQVSLLDISATLAMLWH
jgi:hypothetical protein